ncbi:MAG TPA: sigma-70 family RNA polymerase sigma factor [Longimicrobiaceae bacterium]|nr:sigma-70 family RNA polymerase sigma factor [Longimicrobiaceae bacterium]
MDVARLFAEHHAALFRYLARLTGDADAAADAAQEAFVRMVERPPRPGEVRAWLFRVGTNAALESARTRTRRLRLLDARPERAPMGDAPPTPDEALDREERRRRVQTALATLPERDRRILLMREEGFSHREIAEAVGTTTGSVGTMIARALDRLAAVLPLDEDDEDADIAG